MTEQGFSVSSRFRILSRPDILPGKCAVCGAVDRPVVDFAATIPLYGAILICLACISEAARGVGMVDRAELILAEESLAQSLKTQLNNAGMIGVPRERYDAVLVAIHALSNAVLSSSFSSDAVVAESNREGEPTLFDDPPKSEPESTPDIESPIGSPEQDDHATVSERPISISSRRKYGSIPTI